jgi:digeranylgeranylglycerophospholipid reductase
MGEVGICLQYEMVDVDIDPDAAEMYFGSKFSPGGYAWIIPMGQDVANVGVGVRTQYIERGLRIPSIIEAFIEESPASDKIKRGEVVSVMRGTVPASGTRVLHQGNVLFAGDAAGQVMATSGGGIPLAVVAGSIAGEVAARHVLGQGSLSEYPERIREAFGGELSRSVQIRRMVDLLMRSDKLMDSLFSMIEPEDMKAIQRGQIPGTLGRICRSLGYGGS